MTDVDITQSALILIPARMASTRLPNKPLAMIGDAPMIVHVWRRAMEAGIGPVAVACDDTNIAEAIEAEGGTAVMTRDDHPSGSDRIAEALQKVDPEGKYPIVVNFQGDLPTFNPDDLRDLLALMRDETYDIGTLAVAIEEDDERINPSVVKPVIAFDAQNEDEGRALYFTRCSAPYGEGELFHHIGIYAYKRDALTRFVSLPPSPLEQREKLEQLRALENGMSIGVRVVRSAPLGVDTQADLDKARKLLCPTP